MIELFSVVDDKDIHSYAVASKELLHKGGRLHRAVHVFIEVFGGGFVIQKKAAHTENAGKWSSAVSGHVRAGEAYHAAAVRETEEELGLKISDKDLIKVGKMHPSEATGNEFVVLYSYLLDPEKESISIGCDEVDELITCPINDMVKDVAYNGDKYSPAFVILLDLFLALRK